MLMPSHNIRVSLNRAASFFLVPIAFFNILLIQLQAVVDPATPRGGGANSLIN